MYQKYFVILSLSFFLFSCSSTHRITQKDKKLVRESIENSPVFSTHFTGFLLYEPDTRKTLIASNEHKYFTPASNTKILTLFTSLKILGDSVDLFTYAMHGDSIILQGAANPTFLHPKFEQAILPSFLYDTTKNLFFSAYNFQEDNYGEGWMWDDYNYTFQSEKSSLPIYENNIHIELPLGSDIPLIRPSYFKEVFSPSPIKSDKFRVTRDKNSNLFTYQLSQKQEEPVDITQPFIITPPIISALLADTLHRPVKTWTAPTDSLDFTPVRVAMQDSIYRRLMHQSDNMIAEQLLLMCSHQLFGHQNTSMAITYAKDSIFQFLSDELLWADGSGISRYNLFTPSALVQILDSLYRMVPFSRIRDLFSAGGDSGTIKDWYGGAPSPYVFAKTGTLRNNHNLSGYIITKSNRVLIFSFMNNHFKGDSSRIKKEMEKILWLIYQEY